MSAAGCHYSEVALPTGRTDVYAAYYYDRITSIEYGETFGVGVGHKL